MPTYERRRNTSRRRCIAGLAFLLTGPLVACGGEDTSATCELGREVSPLYPPDLEATADRDTWDQHIAIGIDPPEGAESVAVGFRGDTASPWIDSEPFPLKETKKAVAFLGPDAVYFSALILAPEGSEACADPPEFTVTFSQPTEGSPPEDAILPEWQAK